MTGYRNFEEFVAANRDRVFHQIERYLPKWKEPYDSIVRCYVDRRGQYRRPAYLLLWSALYGGGSQDALLPAAAQQVSEDWLLMQDDWMDSSELRRGKPSAHVLYGPQMAVTASDTLHIVNWKMVTDAAGLLGGSRGKRYLNKFYDMLLTTTRGQYLDLRLTHEIKDVTKFSPEEYYECIQARSAYYSVYGPMQCGAIVANQPDEITEQISEYGLPAGLAFQIRDDVLDCTETSESLGKPKMNDIRNGVKTLILWHAVQNASASQLVRIKTIYEKSREQKTEEDLLFVKATFDELGSIAYAVREESKLANEAEHKFDELSRGIPELALATLARESIQILVERRK